MNSRLRVFLLSIVRLAIVLISVFCIGCTKFDLLNATIPISGYVRENNIQFGPLARHKLDVYRPDPEPEEMRSRNPVVIFFYGGDWQRGERGDYRFVAQALVSRGFVVVMPDYRLYPETQFPGFVEDGALAVKWTSENISKFGGDPDRINLMGHSAGAHIAALLTLDARYMEKVGLNRSIIHSTVGLSGPYDFSPGDTDCAVFSMKQGDANNPNFEPVHFTDGSAPPMLLVQGLKDDIVGPENTYRLADAISKAKGKVEVLIYKKCDHVDTVLSLAWSFRWIAPILDDTARFMLR